MDSVFSEIVGRIKKYPEYLMRLMDTLGLNILESEYQDYEKPRVFLPEYDDIGIVSFFIVNPIYAETENHIHKRYLDLFAQSAERYQALLSRLGEDVKKAMEIDIMANINIIDNKLVSLFGEDLTEDILHSLPPFFKKEYDEMGMPVTVGFNPDSLLTYPCDDDNFDMALATNPEIRKSVSKEEMLAILSGTC